MPIPQFDKPGIWSEVFWAEVGNTDLTKIVPFFLRQPTVKFTGFYRV